MYSRSSDGDIMVSKVAVMALVLIVSVPILLGYGFNLSETVETDYKQQGEYVNVTPLISNDAAYSKAMADYYRINTKFQLDYGAYLNWTYPIYETSSNNSALPMYLQKYNPGEYPTDSNTFSTWTYMYFQSNYDGAGSVTFKVIDTDTNNTVLNMNNVYSIYWELENKTLTINIIDPLEMVFTNEFSFIWNPANQYKYEFSVSAGYSSTGYIERAAASGESTFVDFSKGYYFIPSKELIQVVLPDRADSFLMTVDMNSMPLGAYDYHIYVGYLHLILSQYNDNGDYKWSVTDYNSGTTFIDELYMDQSKSSNTYQIFVSQEKISTREDPNNPGQDLYTNRYHAEFRYIGDWPTYIGPANTYLVYDYDIDHEEQSIGFRLLIGNTDYDLLRTPLMRMDQATFAAFEYYIISDQTYVPSDFKTNPITTLNDIKKFGTGIAFAGNTYTIDSSGNITLGTHKVSVYNLKLESVPIYNGYENRINGITIANSLTPSDIQFLGSWDVSVSTGSLESYTVTKTEWIPGHFAWDGIDDNFLMIGLLTSLGVFIALGIYSRRSKGNMIPLMLVAGGAAFVFLIMM